MTTKKTIIKYIVILTISLFSFTLVHEAQAADRSGEPGFNCVNGICTYTPPIGIPMPAFGIMEHYTMYNDVSKRNSALTYSPDGFGGYYTHYIDNRNTTVTCTNTNNPFGTAQNPRCSIPTTLTEGSIVLVRGGTYTITKSVGYTFTGTVDKPIFLRGIDNDTDKPLMIEGDSYFGVSGSYYIIENFIFDKLNVLTARKDGPRSSYVGLRNLEIRKGAGNAARLIGDNIVLYNSHVHHNQNSGNEAHGVYLGTGARNIWVLNNYIHHNGGDSIQFTHGSGSNPPMYVYIGKNHMHSDRENAVDLKYPQHVVISQNLMHSYKSAPADTNWCFDDGSHCGTWTSGSSGDAVVVGSDGAPDDVWVIFNEIYGSNRGVRVESAGTATVLGNVIHDIVGSAIKIDKDARPLHVLNNTIYKAGKGIEDGYQPGVRLTIQNNIIAESTSQYLHIHNNDTAENTNLDNNLFFASNGQYPVAWRSTTANTFTTAAQFNSLSYLPKSNNIIGDPQFVNSNGNNFQLQSGSPAIDSGLQHSAYQTYLNTFGVDIRFDFNGNPRPQGSAWDIGALEYPSGQSQQDLTPPVISSIASSTTSTTATVTWSTNESATSSISYGLTTSYGAISASPTSKTSHSFTLTGLTPDTLYHFRIGARDSSGNIAASSDLIFNTATVIITDTDGDSVPDSIDLCPSTPAGMSAKVNAKGCIRPRLANFDIKPDVTNLDLRSIPVLELGKTNIGKVKWNSAVMFHRSSAELDIDSNLVFTPKKVVLNSTSLPELNSSAQVTLYNVTETNPKIMKDGADCTTCTINSFSNNTLVFTVTGFSTYEVVEGTLPPVIVATTTPESTPTTGDDAGSGNGGSSSGGSSFTTVYQTTNSQTGTSGATTTVAGIICQTGEIYSTQTGKKCTAWNTSLIPSVSNITTNFTRNLTVGAQGADVQVLQKYLNANGFVIASSGAGSPGNESTYFGPATRNALAKFQVSKGITPAAGYFGQLTRDVINGGSAPALTSQISSGATLKIGSSGSSVKLFRTKLRALGYFAPYGSSSVVPASASVETDYFGATTEAALKKFQCDKGIACSGDANSTGWGVTGPKTRAALGI